MAPRSRPQRFTKPILAAIDAGTILGVRAGSEPHRIIGIWAVVVEERVFVRSWSLKPRSWWRTFQVDPEGIIQVGERQIAIRAVATRSERLKDEVSCAYLEKYCTPGSIGYARDAGRQVAGTTTKPVPNGVEEAEGPKGGGSGGDSMFKASWRDLRTSNARHHAAGGTEYQLSN